MYVCMFQVNLTNYAFFFHILLKYVDFFVSIPLLDPVALLAQEIKRRMFNASLFTFFLFVTLAAFLFDLLHTSAIRCKGSCLL